MVSPSWQFACTFVHTSDIDQIWAGSYIEGKQLWRCPDRLFHIDYSLTASVCDDNTNGPWTPRRKEQLGIAYITHIELGSVLAKFFCTNLSTSNKFGIITRFHKTDLDKGYMSSNQGKLKQSPDIRTTQVSTLAAEAWVWLDEVVLGVCPAGPPERSLRIPLAKLPAPWPVWDGKYWAISLIVGLTLDWKA